MSRVVFCYDGEPEEFRMCQIENMSGIEIHKKTIPTTSRKHKLNPNRLMGLVNERIKGKKPDF